MIPCPRTGAELAELRETMGRTRARQAELLGCHPSTISANEARGEISRWLRRRIERTDGPGGWKTWRGILQAREDRRRQRAYQTARRRAA